MNERSALHFNKYAEDLRDSVMMPQDLLASVLRFMILRLMVLGFFIGRLLLFYRSTAIGAELFYQRS